MLSVFVSISVHFVVVASDPTGGLSGIGMGVCVCYLTMCG